MTLVPPTHSHSIALHQSVQYLPRLLFAVSVILTLILGSTMNAHATNTVAWKEEVQFHNGKTLIVTRTHTYDPKGFREIGQGPPLVEATVTFTVPGTKKEVTWKSNYGRGYEDNLSLLLLDFSSGTPFVATHPARCHAYNKWGRPNPPYVFFKFDGEWKRIPLEQFPADFREANVMLRSTANEHVKKEIQETTDRVGFVPIEKIKKLNRDSEKEYRTIAREPIKTATTICEELVYYKGAWISPKGTFGRDFMDKISK